MINLNYSKYPSCRREISRNNNYNLLLIFNISINFINFKPNYKLNKYNISVFYVNHSISP